VISNSPRQLGLMLLTASKICLSNVEIADRRQVYLGGTRGFHGRKSLVIVRFRHAIMFWLVSLGQRRPGYSIRFPAN